MRRIIVIGCPGSGKSYFSKRLQDKFGLPLYHLDMMFWNSDKTTVEKSVFLERLSSVLMKEEWRIDGNYASTMEERIKAADTVFFLDFPTEVCLDGIKERRGKPRSDMPWIESDEDEDFLEFIRGFKEKQRPEIYALLEKYDSKNITVFHSRAEADDFLKLFQGGMEG